MKNKIVCSIIAVAIAFSTMSGYVAKATTNTETPLLKEALELIRTQMIGGNENELEQKALHGLVDQLYPSVQWVQTNTQTSTDADVKAPTAQKVSGYLYDHHYLALRLNDISTGSDQELLSTWATTAGTNEIYGVILDLRNSKSSDYQAAADVASIFSVSGTNELFTLGAQKYSKKEQAKVIMNQPLAILINKRTSAAAEALASTLHKNGPQTGTFAICIGAQTAGAAVTFKEFTLSNGEKLRIAIDTLRFPDGTYLPAGGLAPDISVYVSEEDEKNYMADPFKNLRPTLEGTDTTATTNKVSIRINEAELVKMQNGGKTTTNASSATDNVKKEEEQVIYDPVLSRAIDLFKSLHFWKKTKK